MTEAEWLACEDPDPMLASLGATVSQRKLRLFSVGCCRSIWEKFEVPAVRELVELVERAAENPTAKFDMGMAREVGIELPGSYRDTPLGFFLYGFLDPGALNAAAYTVFCSPRFGGPEGWRAVQRVIGQLLHDIFGNPFHPTTFLPVWRSSTVVALAQQMYESRDFSAMPILADALEEANCTDETILAHCRGAGPHVRGCWVTDACLGKS
jgi:hypothetical protein